MKKAALFLCALLVLFSGRLAAQNKDSTDRSWHIEPSALFYFVPGDLFFLPIVKADKNKLHLEARYNYEDLKTFSFFAGYNISGGKKLEYTFTPMLGFVTGNSDGIAPGLEMDLTLGKFGFYSEMEYLFEFNSTENQYYYNWSELTFAPTEWLWLGISGQRTRMYQTELDIQRGMLAGFSLGRLEVSGYYFNPFTDDQFGILSLAYPF